MKARLLSLMALMALASASSAQEAQRERLRQAFPAEAVTRIETILAEAEAEGIPTDPLVAKALEGAAKRVPAERVLAALSTYADRLQQAMALVGPQRGQAEVVAAADAVRRGVPPAAVEALAGQHPVELAVPLVVLADLMEAGVPVQGAYNLVDSALKQEHRPDEMLAIPGAVRRLMRGGQLPAEAAAAVGEAMGRGQFRGVGNPQGTPGIGPPSGPPVPPGAGPPDKAGDRGQGRGKGPPGGLF